MANTTHTSQLPAPVVSIVLEWENILLSKVERCRRMLETVRKQCAELGVPSELLVVYDPDVVSVKDIESMLATCGVADADDGSFRVRVHSESGTHYYEMKNRGARIAQGEVLVLVDSDVVPEPGWLQELTSPLRQREDIVVVCGQTHIDPVGLVGKAFALGWFFPQRATESTLHAQGEVIYANNVAFRRSFFLDNPFPALSPGRTRGACGELARDLRGRGIALWTHTGARTSHPPPNGAAHILRRAFAEGRDRAVRDEPDFQPSWRDLESVFVYCGSRLRKMTRQLAATPAYVGLKQWEKPVVLSMMTGYYALVFAGAVITIQAPELGRSMWRI